MGFVAVHALKLNDYLSSNICLIHEKPPVGTNKLKVRITSKGKSVPSGHHFLIGYLIQL